MVFCKKCGKELSDGAKFCGECGTVVASQQVYNNFNNETVPQECVVIPNENTIEQAHVSVMGKRTFNKKILPIIIAAAASLIIIVILIIRGISLSSYEKKLLDAYDSMTYGAEQAEQYASLESKVWRNCIYENSSDETDKYTKNEYGWYYSDFNDALSSFYEGESLTYSIVSINVKTVNSYMSELKKCPKKYEDEYIALKELYVAYSDLTDLVVGDSTYSWTTFNDTLEDAKSDYKEALSSAKLLLE